MIKQEVLKGFLIGLLSASIGFALCTFILAQVNNTSFSNIINSFKNDDKLWMLLALGAIPNLLCFYLLLRKDLDYKARGVVLATLLVAFITYTIYFL